ncbi:MAVS protein, partial [Brachypteracias leptosomus]|nr:MAVS protein [Brachypteracias leptosomus]
MGFVEDRVYEYIMKHLSHFKNIRVAPLVDSLSCLSDTDRDELHTREETRGNNATAYRFYQFLKCRQGWVLDLIEALRHNNAGHLADELQLVYDSCQPRRYPPCPKAPTTASDARPAASSISAQTPSPGPSPAPSAPSAQQPPRDMPLGDHPPLLPSGASTTSDDLDARAPVQESLPKTLLEPESPRPPPLGSTVHDGASDGHGGDGHLPHPSKATQVASETPRTVTMAVPSSAPPEQGGQAWLSRPQHPVCVDNGCFGNANHLQRGAPGLGLRGSLPPREVGAAPSPKQPHNEPEENSYVSTVSPPRLEETSHTREMQPPSSPPNKQAAASSAEPPSSFVDVRSPLLIQQQFDAEQKLVRMLQESRDGDTQMESTTPVATLVPRAASPSWDTSLKPPVQEEKPLVGQTVGSTPSMEKVPPALMDSLPPVARSSEGTSGRMASRGSSVTSIWTPCNDEERDVELSKPGVLLSTIGVSPEGAGRCPQGTSSPCCPESGSLSFSSSSLMVSTNSSSSAQAPFRVSSGCLAPAAPADPGIKEAAGASRNSHPPPSWDSTHEVHVDHYPSTQLEADNNLRDGADLLDLSRGRDAATSSSEAKMPPGDSHGPSLLYILPTMGIAVLAVAFLVYNRWRK